MKRPQIIIIGIIVVFVVVTVTYLWPSTNRDNNNDNSAITNTSDGYPTVKLSADGQNQIVESAHYNFSLQVPVTFTYHPPQSGGSAPFTIWFSQTNPNTSEQPNRDTPNGFNTAADNTWSIAVYNNDSSVTTSDSRSLLDWRTSYDLGASNDSSETVTAGQLSLTRFTQADGIDSHGYYYYLVRPAYIYVFGSGDFTDTEMGSFISNFRITE